MMECDAILPWGLSVLFMAMEKRLGSGFRAEIWCLWCMLCPDDGILASQEIAQRIQNIRQDNHHCFAASAPSTWLHPKQGRRPRLLIIFSPGKWTQPRKSRGRKLHCGGAVWIASRVFSSCSLGTVWKMTHYTKSFISSSLGDCCHAQLYPQSTLIDANRGLSTKIQPQDPSLLSSQSERKAVILDQ